MTYTHFNQPEMVTFANGGTIQYTYAANGAKVQEIVSEGGSLGRGEVAAAELVGSLFSGTNLAKMDELLQGNDIDPSRPQAYLNYVLFEENGSIYGRGSGRFQAEGDGEWKRIGTGEEALVMPRNGYLAVYLSNASTGGGNALAGGDDGDVFFDLLSVWWVPGPLLEENHYYPFGLPMKDKWSGHVDLKAHRFRYQGNEYVTENGLNWMDFNFRQYDPQIGRFLSVDPLAAFGGQDSWSPYAAMGNNPGMRIDPDGLISGEFHYLPPFSLAEPFMFSSFAMGKGKIDNDIKDYMAARGIEIDYFDALGKVLIAILSNPGGVINSGGLVANFGAGGGGGDVGDDKDRGAYSDSRYDIEVEGSEYANVLQDYYESHEGGTYHLSIWRFFDIVKQARDNQAIEYHKAVYNEETGVYSVPVNLYKTDYWASFGRSTLLYKVDEGGSYKNNLNRIHFVGFSDTWDLDTKPWGTRSYFSEVITRYYNWKLNGTNFKVSYP